MSNIFYVISLWNSFTNIILFYFILFYFILFILKEREHVHAGEEQRERGRENPKQALHCQHRAQCVAQIHEP